MNWNGVMPAITTCFKQDLGIDHAFMADHCRWLLDNGCTGIVVLGSLGEGATLSFEEKQEVVRNCIKAVHARAPIVAAISSLSTSEAVALAKSAADLGCDGLMVLPPYVYRGSWREMKTYVAAVFEATTLSCMLYNNPVAYGTDFVPEQIRELSEEHKNFAAVKESSTDVRRVSAIRALLDRRLEICVGVDDAVLEAIAMGATGWIAGLANALPRESVELFNCGINGPTDNGRTDIGQTDTGQNAKAFRLYRWFLPLLRMDTLPNFVQLIKLVQAEVGMGNSRVRPPRLELVGNELDQAKKIIGDALQSRLQAAGG